MQRIVLLCILIAVSLGGLNAQTCDPDPSLITGTQLISPLPYLDTVPGSGIMDTVCLNVPYQSAFTIMPPSSANIGGAVVNIAQLELNPETAIPNLPAGMDYVCNPPDCIFPADSASCILLFGTVTDPALAGENVDLQIEGQVRLTIGLSINVSFPDPTLAPGNYFLPIRDENNPYCMTVGVENPLAEAVSISHAPNPVYGMAEISAVSSVSGNYRILLFDARGQVIRQEAIQLSEGMNRFAFDTNNLPNGMYLYSITDGQYHLTNKLIVQR